MKDSTKNENHYCPAHPNVRILSWCGMEELCGPCEYGPDEDDGDEDGVWEDAEEHAANMAAESHLAFLRLHLAKK